MTLRYHRIVIHAPAFKLSTILAACIALVLPAPCADAQANTIELGSDNTWRTSDRAATLATSPLNRRVLDIARSLLARDEPGRAKKLLDDFIDRNGRDPVAPIDEALRLRGDAKLAMGNEYRALFDYERLIREYPESAQFPIAIEREIEIAELYLAGLRRPVLGLRIESGRGTAEELLIRAQERMPGSRLAERAAITLADEYYRTRDLTLAAEMYDVFLRNFPDSPFRKRAMRNRVYATIATFKGPSYDGLGLLEAELLIEEFAALYPAEADRALLTDALIARIDESGGAQQLVVAQWYLTVGDEAAAAYTLRRLLRDYPGTVAGTRALQILEERGWLEQARASDATRPTFGPSPEPAPRLEDTADEVGP